MTKTQARALEIDFTRGYYTSSQGVLRGTKDAATHFFNSVEDLNNASCIIGLQAGTTSDLYALNNLPNAVVNAYADFASTLTALEQEDVHVVLGDAPVLKSYASNNPALATLVDTFNDENFGIGVRYDTVTETVTTTEVSTTVDTETITTTEVSTTVDTETQTDITTSVAPEVSMSFLPILFATIVIPVTIKRFRK
jgi:hypothetical protein